MKHFCTSLDQGDLPGALALHRSLTTHAGEFELVILCMDAVVAGALQIRALPHTRLVPLAELTGAFPALAPARVDRTEAEFQLTCVPWLFRHLLPRIPAGELLTFLAGDLYFFSSPQPIYDEIGAASVALSPFRYAAAHAALARFGKFNNGWLALRHDATGLACAADWAEKCATWCFALLEPARYGNQKYLEAWPEKFPGTVALNHPGANLAPWNVANVHLMAAAPGPLVDGRPLVFYHFHFLRHLVSQLYDPGLFRFGVTPTRELRELVYLPYLRELARFASASDEPDIVPPARADDPRASQALLPLLESRRAAREEAAASQLALEKNQAASRQALAASRQVLTHTELLLKDVEADRAAQRLSLLKLNQEVKKAYFDLAGNVTYIKELLAETAALTASKDAQIASLTAELDRRAVAAAQVEQEDLRVVLEPYSRKIRRLLVAKFHPHLLPEILWLSLFGTAVEVLGSPPEYAAAHGGVGFHQESLLEWLGHLDSLFDERAYRLAHPDVVRAIAMGQVTSGWDHYQRFGQREGRSAGTPAYSPGLADFDAVAFDGSDAPSLAPFLAGRMQPHHQLFVSGFIPPTDWLPLDEGRTYLMGHTLYCPRPPATWLGPRQPTGLLGRNLRAVTAEEIYPEKPTQCAAWPRISVITVAGHAGAILEETLRSVLDQNYPNLEYIVIGGDPTDGAAEVIKPHAARLVWRSGENATSLTQGINRGLAQATGRILTWLNPGDRLAPGSLFTVGQTFLLHGTDVVAGRCGITADHAPAGHSLHRNHYPLDRIQPLSAEELLALDRGWLHARFFQQPEVFFTDDIFKRAGGRLREDLNSTADYELWVRFAKAGARLFALPEILAIVPDSPAADPAQVAELRAVCAAHQSSS